MGNARKHNHARRRNRSSKVSVKRDPRRALLAGLPPELRARWDARRTLSQNYAALGLAAHVSAPADVKKHAPGLLSGALGGEARRRRRRRSFLRVQRPLPFNAPGAASLSPVTLLQAL